MENLKTVGEMQLFSERLLEQFGVLPKNLEITVILNYYDWITFCEELSGYHSLWSTQLTQLNSSLLSGYVKYTFANTGITFKVKRQVAKQEVDEMVAKLDKLQNDVKILSQDIKERNL